ncbi:MAG: hypothetical protein ABI999_17450, partial [Acidobacteriota bacterium]
TMVTDPADPSARPQPVREYVRQKLSKAKQRKLIDDIVAANHISVPADFTIPIIPGTAPVKKAPAAAKKTTMSRRKTAVSRKHRPLRKRTSK